jgi:hypothetical protein
LDQTNVYSPHNSNNLAYYLNCINLKWRGHWQNMARIVIDRLKRMVYIVHILLPLGNCLNNNWGDEG